jgi:hypothetical protein
MNLAYLVDTDWAIHWLHGDERVRKHRRSAYRKWLKISRRSSKVIA